MSRTLLFRFLRHRLRLWTASIWLHPLPFPIIQSVKNFFEKWFTFHKNNCRRVKGISSKCCHFFRYSILSAPVSNQPQRCVSTRYMGPNFVQKSGSFLLSHQMVWFIIKGEDAYEAQRRPNYGYHDVWAVKVDCSGINQETVRSHPEFLHRDLHVTNTGLLLPSLVDIVYLELDKCLSQWAAGVCPEEYAELALWLCAIADVNHPVWNRSLTRPLSWSLSGLSSP